jgi:hypothetical protein
VKRGNLEERNFERKKKRERPHFHSFSLWTEKKDTLTLTGFRTYHPRIWYLEKAAKTGSLFDLLLPFSLEVGHKRILWTSSKVAYQIFISERPSLCPEQRKEEAETGRNLSKQVLLNSPCLLPWDHSHLPPIRLLHDCP